MPYARNGSVRIWWDEHGQGDPALLCMGFAYGSVMWHRAVTALARQYRVLTFDNRGVGYSDAPPAPYTIEDLAADAIAVADAAGAERVHVYGASLGGLTAQEIALSHPGRVRSLVLGCTGTLDESDGKVGLRQYFIHLIPTRVLRHRDVGNNYGPDVDQQVREEDLLLVRSTRMTRQGIIGQAQAVGAYRSKKRLAGLDVPTLVLHGDQDQVVALSMGQDLAAVIPGARLEVLAGAGHNYLTDVDAPGNRLVLDFWAEVAARERGQRDGASAVVPAD